MQVSVRVKTLIDEASMRAGNDRRLAKMIEATPGNVCDWRTALRPCPLEAQILMAAIAGRDVDGVIKDALIERNAGTARGEKLVSALGKGLMGLGAATALTLCANDALAFNLPGVLRCILC
jgi:hypothetical protein